MFELSLNVLLSYILCYSWRQCACLSVLDDIVRLYCQQLGCAYYAGLSLLFG